MTSKPCLHCVEAMPRDGHGRDCREWSAIRNAQMQWNVKMQRLLAREPKSMRGFSFMPKGEVQ